ncbi:MAG: zinc-ribbon domain-containing protein [Sideroxydans sp.]|nr:zinc-ribbon domain-containing protein [Sideroxydans sp.]
MFCSKCGIENVDDAKFCKSCGTNLGFSNSSTEAIPEGVKGWSWGAFLLNWIWAIGNKTWIGLLALIPIVGIVMAIILGINGREWAWNNRTWDSVDHFNRVQKKWSFWGVIVALLMPFVIGLFAAIAVPAYRDYQHKAQEVERERAAQESVAEEARLQTQNQVRENESQSVVSWSSMFKQNTYNECADRAMEKGDTNGVVFCGCLIDKASTTISEQRMRALETDQEVRAEIQNIAASCKQ